MAGTKDTKKVISVEAIGLFADTEKKNMSPLRLSMYNYIQLWKLEMKLRIN